MACRLPARLALIGDLGKRLGDIGPLQIAADHGAIRITDICDTFEVPPLIRHLRQSIALCAREPSVRGAEGRRTAK